MPWIQVLYRLTRPAIRLWWRLSRGVTLGARIVAVDADGRVALVRHSYRKGWFLPGGGVERGEQAEDAARRELAEEAHAELAGPLELVGVYANFTDFPGDHVLLYRASARSRGARPADHEVREVIWVDPLDPPDGATPATRRRLAELFANAPPSRAW